MASTKTFLLVGFFITVFIAMLVLLADISIEDKTSEMNRNESAQKLQQLERAILSDREDLAYFRQQFIADHQELIGQRRNISKQWHAIKKLEMLMRARLDSEIPHPGLQKHLKALTLRPIQNNINSDTHQGDVAVKSSNIPGGLKTTLNPLNIQQTQPPSPPTAKTSTVTVTSSNPTSIGQNCDPRIDTDFLGGDMPVVPSTGSLAQCCDRCEKIHGCRAWSFVEFSGVCWLKAKVVPARRKHGVISGISSRARTQQSPHFIGDIPAPISRARSATSTTKRYKTRATTAEPDPQILNATRACSHLPILEGQSIDTAYLSAMQVLQNLISKGACQPRTCVSEHRHVGNLTSHPNTPQRTLRTRQSPTRYVF